MTGTATLSKGATPSLGGAPSAALSVGRGLAPRNGRGEPGVNPTETIWRSRPSSPSASRRGGARA